MSVKHFLRRSRWQWMHPHSLYCWCSIWIDNHFHMHGVGEHIIKGSTGLFVSCYYTICPKDRKRFSDKGFCGIL